MPTLKASKMVTVESNKGKEFQTAWPKKAQER